MTTKYSSMTNLQGAIMAMADVKKNPLTNMQGIQRVASAIKARRSSKGRTFIQAQAIESSQKPIAMRSLDREEYLAAVEKEWEKQQERRREEIRNKMCPIIQFN
jgi:hypothetical protein